MWTILAAGWSRMCTSVQHLESNREMWTILAAALMFTYADLPVMTVLHGNATAKPGWAGCVSVSCLVSSLSSRANLFFKSGASKNYIAAEEKPSIFAF